ncbi:alcohol dehydrogenase [candidate division KSB1 bacterium]|nr:MAG: hypothetical protein B5M50_06825 [candidate division KSB1 bacterium 4484_219]RKY80278.1 MAG: alcohol dehydrogenase [candidate division KSB1 bacterium]RKY86750.1 MAG: alcohol dehydrogenase [candidate division KSB1 bacterium]RKY88781.1 MAG: alcohol dehydrogenase [candidate division KSB1 bacterium]
MKAAIFKTKHNIVLETNKAVAPPTAKEVLVKVDTCGVCGTDIHIFDGEAKASPPVVLGHEFCGTVEKVGLDVSTIAPGAWVAIDPNIHCDSCFYCRKGLINLCQNLRAIGVNLDGGFAEYCLVPATQVYQISDSFPHQWGALAEPISCALRGIERAQIRSGESVVILGAGNIGLIMLQLAQIAGAGRLVVVEPLPERRQIAQQIGCDGTIDPKTSDAEEQIQQMTGGGADVVIECVGKTEAATMAVRIARCGGRIVIFGLAEKQDSLRVNLQDLFYRELSILGSILNPFTFQTAIQLLNSGKIRFDYYKTQSFTLEQIQRAFAAHREGKYHKIFIKPNI